MTATSIHSTSAQGLADTPPEWVVTRLQEVAARLHQLVGVMRNDDAMRIPLSNSALQIESVVRALGRVSSKSARQPTPMPVGDTDLTRCDRISSMRDNKDAK